MVENKNTFFDGLERLPRDALEDGHCDLEVTYQMKRQCYHPVEQG
jgi:hypothetical protein